MKNARNNSTICWSKKFPLRPNQDLYRRSTRGCPLIIVSTKENLCLQRNTRLRRSDLVERQGKHDEVRMEEESATQWNLILSLSV
ncbi:unnamed protein product [Cylicocyclus nassatus]|uniref:Uncharacterized protein n=1 Tax=Cylicocyclus nassatus TaxID=53992 RepID=A0AA36GMW0_CYLNA|nr:unnamed protein product [Cylicocyclus nassatus]